MEVARVASVGFEAARADSVLAAVVAMGVEAEVKLGSNAVVVEQGGEVVIASSLSSSLAAGKVEGSLP